MLDSDASTAKTLALVAIILQAVFFLIGIVSVVALLGLLATSTAIGPGGTMVGTPGLGIGIAGVIFGVAFLFGLLWILLDYFLVYKKLAEERVQEAETPSIVLGIIQLIFGGIITGILLIVAYVKIRDSLTRRATYMPPPQQPVQ